MNRRSFLRGLAVVAGGLALTEAIPLGRVWSFPSKIVIPRPATIVVAEPHLLEIGDLIQLYIAPAVQEYARIWNRRMSELGLIYCPE